MFKCQYPNCKYETNFRNQIDYHHIVPKELGGSDKAHNRIYLCPNHHKSIYVPEAKHGIHSINNNSTILIRKVYSTAGFLLEYKENDEIKYCELRG